MKYLTVILTLVLLLAGGSFAASIPGDLDSDGDVDFDDFFILAANFGKKEAQAQPQPQPAEFSLASVNIRIFSTASRSDAELAKIADRLQQYDLVAVQELRDTVVVARTLAIMAQRGIIYKAEISAPVGRGSSLERYAFFYRPDRITVIKPGNIHPDPQDKFIREPFVGTFRAGSFDFTLITIHVIFGDSQSERRAESVLLDDVYIAVQDADLTEQDVIILGDFNLPPEDEGFTELRTLLIALFWGNLRTTISDASLYDNIWFDPQYVQEYTGKRGIDRFDETAFGNDDGAASLAVSDHRPVWAKFRTDRPDDD